ncbi:GntR family transcriptional regulator [Orrella sp. JC864]|uniref:GntR family transcriptional regulator n=1 Tax=Orrella sp. JC864 TaxID=3120298 RepID=UPI003008BEF7
MDACRLKPIDRQTLWDRAYAELRNALLAGRFAPGERIVLREIAGELGISLTPVRDAVNHLIAERVLERGTGGQGGGATVPFLDAEQFRQLTIMRADIEARAALEAAAHAGDADLARLQDCLAAMRRSIDNERQRYLDLHRQFHFGIYALADMPVVHDVIENLWLRCGPVLTAVLPEYVPYIKRADHHEAALRALARRDGQAVADAIRRDITEAGAYIHRLLKEPAAAGG